MKLTLLDVAIPLSKLTLEFLPVPLIVIICMICILSCYFIKRSLQQKKTTNDSKQICKSKGRK